MDGLYSSNDPINERPGPPAAVAAVQPVQPQIAVQPQPQYHMQPQLPGQMQQQLPYQPQQQFQQPQFSFQAMPAAPGNCFSCGQLGHMARECPRQRQGGYQSRPPANRSGFKRNDRRNGPRDGQNLTCYRCLQKGHFTRDCQLSEQEAGKSYKQNLERFYPKPQGTKASVQAVQESAPAQPAAAGQMGGYQQAWQEIEQSGFQ